MPVMSEVSKEKSLTAKDLRVGNLFTDAYYDTFKRVMVVESIHEKGINAYPSDDGKPYGMASPTIEYEHEFIAEHNAVCGIPLNEEWLIKLGFEKKPLADGFFKYEAMPVMLHMPFTVYLPYFEFTYNDGDDSVELKYVHQLQNLFFALSGEELKLSEPTIVKETEV